MHIRIGMRIEGASKLTVLEAKFQVVLCDDEDGHSFDEEEEAEGDAERAFAAFLQPKVVRRQREQGLAERERGVKGTHHRRRNGK